MLTKLTGGRIFDPARQCDGVVEDLYMQDGKIVPAPAGMRPDVEYDASGHVVMAGGIDIHTHIGGGKVSIGRMLMTENHRRSPHRAGRFMRSGSGEIVPSTFTTGYRYAAMGYTACFEPAMLPVNARQAHMEMADTPIVDAGAYALLGNDDFLLRQIAAGKDQDLINDYVAWTMHACHALGIKVVNPGGINAFKYNQRSLDLDEKQAAYGITPRQVLLALARAVHDNGVPHPLHVHGCNLGVPGNLQSTLRTIDAAEGLPMHLTHVQFHSYGIEGDRKFSSGAAQVAEAVNANPAISVDVGQPMFGQTVTASGDTMQQYRAHRHAHPAKWVAMDIECDAGCGVVPFRYRDRSFVHALQWCTGLELFLLVTDPWRIFLTTDHPNGAPFSAYPRLIRLLMDRSFRNRMLDDIHPAARKASTLDSITREYSLYDIATITRAAPARSLGLADRGHLGVGASADVAVYRDEADREAMFAKPELVFKDGVLVARNGKIHEHKPGCVHVVRPDFDRGIEKQLHRYFERYGTVRLDNFKIDNDELLGFGRTGHSIHACTARS